MSLMKGSLVDDVDSTFLEALSPVQQIKVSEQKCPFCSKKYVYKSNFKKHLLEGCDAVDIVDETVNTKSPLVPPKNIKKKASTSAAPPKTSKIKRITKSPSMKTVPDPFKETNDIKNIADTNHTNDINGTNDTNGTDDTNDTDDIIGTNGNIDINDTNDSNDINDTNGIDINESETQQDIVNSHTDSKLDDASIVVHLSDVKMEEGVDILIPEENHPQQNYEIIPDSSNSLKEVDSKRSNSISVVNGTHVGHQPLEVSIN